MTFSLLAASTLVCGLLIGLIPTIVDGIRTPLQTRLNLADGRLDWFVRLFYFSWIPAMPGAGWLLDNWPNHSKEVLFFGLVALIVAVSWLALVRSAASLLLAGVFLGIAYSCVSTAAISLMPLVFFTDHLRDSRLTVASLNVGFVAVGVGALIGPWVVRVLERMWGYRQGLLYLSITLIVPAALIALCDRSFPQPADGTASWDEVITQPRVGLIVAVILLYFALENCLEFWPESYLKQLGYQETGLQISMLVFWLAFIGTRAVAAWLLFEYAHHSHFAAILTIVLVISSALVLGNLSGGFDVGSGTLGFWLLGACYGPLLPGFLGLALDAYPKPIPNAILGGLLALSGFDTLLVRPCMAYFGKDRPARAVMWAPATLALVLAAPLLLLTLLRN